MLEFLDIQVKNFLSYGNNWTRFEFKKGIHRITGPNGHGKSTIPTDALNFGLFGRPYRKVKLGQLVNTINRKDMAVILRFRKDDKHYRIERGLKPDYFRIYEEINGDDRLIPVSSSKRGYQEILEQDILCLNENLVNQLMIKSLTKNISFMTLSKSDKRAIIENLLDIELFSVISKNIKTKLDNLEFSISATNKDINNINMLIEHELSNLEQLKNIKRKIEDESKQKVDEINKEIATLKETNKKYQIALTKIAQNKIKKRDLIVKINQLKETLRNLRDRLTSRQADIKLATKKLKLFKDSCGDCPKIAQIVNMDDTSKLNNEVKELELKMQAAKTQITTNETSLKKIDEILANEKFVNGGLDKNIKKIAELEKSIVVEVQKEITIDETKLKKHQRNKKQLEKQLNEQAKLRKHFQILKSLFSDEGIKSFIIKKYLPHINKLLNTYLMKFNSDIIFNFDSDFNEVILSKYKENFSYFSFSEGQKKRIDLAVLFAFINFAMFKNKKSNTNLLILDEILSGLDAEGKNRLHELLREYRDSQNKCIITISHDSDIDVDNFDSVYKVEIVKGFSNIEKVEI